MKQKSFSLLVLASVCLCISPRAAMSGDRAAAKAEFDKAEEAFRKRDFPGARDLYGKAIELDPYYAEAHKMYVHTSRTLPALIAMAKGESTEGPEFRSIFKAAEEQTIREYEARLEKDPKNAVVEYALGWAYYYKDHRKSEQHYRRAIELDSSCAHALFDMSLIAEMQGNLALMREYQRKASEAAPDDDYFAFHYAVGGRETDKAGFRRLGSAFLGRFPKSKWAGGTLRMLAESVETPSERIAFLERMRKEYPAESASSMRMLVEEYAKSDPPKAVAFAREMAQTDAKTWQPILEKQQLFFEASKLIADKKFAEAGSILQKIKAGRYENTDRLELLKAEALDGQQQTAQAFQNLAKIAAAAPTDVNLAGLRKYGTKLGKTSAEVGAELAKIRSAAATSIQDFSLEGFGANEGRKLSLADFKGKVVLLNFWYPG